MPTLAALATEPTARAIEYYNAQLNHYFVTAFPEEAASLDAGFIVPGWKRTGVEFGAWANAGDAPGTVPVCRFFGTPGVGPNSHFYTASATECALVKKNPDWTFEAIAFYIAEPVNLMGASKRLMEHLMFSGVGFAGAARMSSARFANVAFSQGSLLESFVRRLEKRQPLAAP